MSKPALRPPQTDHVLEVIDPPGPAAPVVLDSPHSGAHYPVDFMPICPRQALRQAEDSYVDELIELAPQAGVSVVNALFPRSYIDPNRSLTDIDPKLLSAPWPGPVHLTDKGRIGMGLVRRLCRPGMPMYGRRLTVAEIQYRIEHYYRPYMRALDSLIDGFAESHGAVWHINCHSMPSVGALLANNGGWQRADFVLGDRDGETSEPEFLRVIAESLRKMGYSVRINDPYKGVELVRRFGRPAEGRHSVQLEINRRLYMDEISLERLQPEFEETRQALARLAEVVVAYSRDRLSAAAAD